MSNSSRRRFVRKRLTFEGPGAGAVGWGFSDDGCLRLLDLRLRALARDELLVEDDILEAVGSPGAVITWYRAYDMFWWFEAV